MRCLPWALAALAGVVAATDAAAAPRAVVVGVGQYADPALSTLEGPPHDARAMQALLVDRFGFAADDVVLLTDAQATREGILRALAEATAAVGAGDPLVFYFSGHGSRTADASGDEPDGWDEGLVPYDSGRDGRPNLDLLDDELNAVLRTMVGKGAQVTFVYDACHSGTGTRDPLARVGAEDPRFRVISAPPAGQSAGWADDDLGEGWTLIAAAREEQLAFEKLLGPEGQRRGLLTWTLVDALRSAPPRASLRDVFEAVRVAVRQRDARQDPQLEGPGADRVPFGTRARPLPTYVAAEPDENPEKGGAVLQIGEAHGVRRGAVYVVAPPGSRKPPPDAPAGRVLQIAATTAWVDIPPEIPIAPGSRAFLRSAGPPDPRMLVHVEPGGWPLADEVRKTLARHPAISTVPPLYRSAARLIVRAVDGQVVIETNDGRRLDAVDLPELTELVAPRVRTRLLPWIRWMALADLRGGGALPIDLTAGKGSRGTVQAKAGDALKLTVRNDSSVDLYITLLALGADGSITVVYPLPGAKAFVPGFGQWRKTVEAALPDGVERATDRIKLIATSTPTDFRFLQQGPVADGAGAKGVARTGLDVLWATAGFGAPDPAGPKGLTAGPWAARELVIETSR